MIWKMDLKFIFLVGKIREKVNARSKIIQFEDFTQKKYYQFNRTPFIGVYVFVFIFCPGKVN